MNNEPLHGNKPALIEHVSDDVRALRQLPSEQQKVMLSGRGLADLLTGDRFDPEVAADKRFFTNGGTEEAPVWKLDFNLMTNAMIRFVDNDRVNGPAVNGPLSNYAGFIHVTSVLPSGSLIYTDTERREGDPVAVRQMFYPVDEKNLESYTRVGKYDSATETWHWTEWVNMSGLPIRILLTNVEVAEAVMANIHPGCVYELHVGAVPNIQLPDADKFNPGAYIGFEQYANLVSPSQKEKYKKVEGTNDSVPSPLTRYFVAQTFDEQGEPVTFIPAGNNEGWLTEFVRDTVYYVEKSDNSTGAWNNTVRYSEYVLEEGTPVEKTYETQMTPSLDTVRTSSTDTNSGMWYKNSSQAQFYRFEIVHREMPVTVDGVTSYNTWLLDVDPEAMTAVSDMAELLDAHTDPMLTDIVKYEQRQFRAIQNEDPRDPYTTGNVSGGNEDYYNFVPRSNEPLIVSRPATVPGWIKFQIVGNTAMNSTTPTGYKRWLDKLSADFVIKIYRYNEFSSDFKKTEVFTYEQVDTTVDPTTHKKPTPNMYQKYYMWDADSQQYRLCGSLGFITEFDDGVNYFIRKVNYSSTDIEPATFKIALDGQDSETEHRAEFFGNDNGVFSRGGSYWNNHDDVAGYIKANRNDTIMVVIESNNHYLKNKESGELLGDIELVSPIVEFYPDPHGSYLIRPFLSKSAITTSELAHTAKPGEGEEMVASAAALVRAYETLASRIQAKGLLFGNAPMGENTNLNSFVEPGMITINKESGVSNLPESITDYKNLILAVFNSNSIDSSRLLPDGEERSLSGTFRVAQVLFNGSNIWMRTGSGANKESVSWTPWTTYRPLPFNVEWNVSTQGNEISSNFISQQLDKGEPIITIFGQGSQVTVDLPDPRQYKGKNLKIEVINAPIKISYSVDETPYEYTNTTVTETPDRMVYPIEQTNDLWYVMTVN